MAVNCILFSIGFVLMLTNDGVIHLDRQRTPIDPKLMYDGIYVDLLSYEQRITSCGSDETCVYMIDTETGFPAASYIAAIGKDGKELARINTVRFTHQEMPVILRFVDDVAAGFTYRSVPFDFLNEDGQDYIWKTDPVILQEMLSDYSSQVSVLLS